MKPDVAYVPRPSATPVQIAEAAEKGSASPLYTGNPAPMGLADYGLSQDGDLYVPNYYAGTVSVIDGATNTVVTTIVVGAYPNCAVYDSDNSEVYVSNLGTNFLTVISTSTNTVLTTIVVGSGPDCSAFDPANGYIYVPNVNSNDVSVVNGATESVVATLPAGTSSATAAFDSINAEVYVGNSKANSVTVINADTNSIVTTISVGTFPYGLTFDSANADVYVSDAFSNEVSVIDGATNSVVATIPVGNTPNSLAYDSENGYVYVPNNGSNTVSVIYGATNAVVATIPVGVAPEGAGIDLATQQVYIANDGSNNVTVIDGMTNDVVASIPVESGPAAVVYDSEGPLTPSIVNTTSLLGIVDTNGVGIHGEDLYQSIPDGFSIQMNAVLTNITLLGEPGYEFWAQDVITYFPTTGYMLLVTNVWNYSMPGAPVTANAIYMHGPDGISNYAALGYYYASYTVPYRVSYPFNATLTMTSSVLDGQNEVQFSADVLSPTGAFTSVSMPDYDYVVFNSDIGAITTPSNFTASGSGYNDADLLNDFELVVCGPGGGSQVDLSAADATLAMLYLTPGNYYHNATWAPIPSAFNYGSDTGETSIGANVAWGSSPAGSPNGITPFGNMTSGPSILSGLWGTPAPEGSYPLTYFLSPENGFTFFNYTGAPGYTSNFVSEFDLAPNLFASHTYTNVYYLMPGTYKLHIEMSDYTPTYVTLNIVGPQTFNLNLSRDPSLGVYTPEWAFNNYELSELAQSGAGTSADPYVLYNYQPAPLSSDFGLYNDYSFPVFPGVFLKDTTASVDLNNSSTFETTTNDFQPYPGLALPQTNELQFWFWNVSGVALVNDTNITGWFGLENYFPLTYNSFNVVFFASEHNLVANNTFLSQSQALLMYNNGTFYGRSISVGGNNTVWGNHFVQIDPPVGCPGPVKCLPLLPYNSGLGLEIGEGYDLIYNNMVATPTTAWLLPLNLYTENPYVWANDVWNISSEPASYVQYASGFPTIPLTGSIVGSSTQGGNSWWDYGVTTNWANGADNPTGVLPYDEDASSLIDPEAGYGSPLPGYPCPEYYCATYIYSGGDYDPLPTVAAAVTLGPHGLVGITTWGVVVTCNPAKSGGGGPAKTGGGGPAKSGGGGVCSAVAGEDPPPLTLVDFETTATSVNVVLPNGAYSWTPIVPAGYTSTVGGTFLVSSAEPVTVTVPYAPPGSAVVTFSESGLPAGLTWTVSLGGVPSSIVTDGGIDDLMITEPNGDYSYSIAGISGWQQSTLPYSGTVDVDGAPVTEPTLIYTQTTYSVSFAETGLPSSLTWQVTVGGVAKSLTTNGATDSLTWTGLANGTYAYSITSISGWPQSTLPYTGNVVVNGASVTEPTLAYVPATYSVTFLESGLPSGQTWAVTVAGDQMSLTTNGATDSLTFVEPSGTYAYSIAGNAGWHQGTLPYSGNVVVNGGGVTESTLVYTAVTYQVTFTESGLPSGLTWAVSVNGVAEHLTTDGGTDTLTWTGLANGTYSYSITGLSGWTQTTLPYSGSVAVNGASVKEITLAYTHVTYSVTFAELGLISGLTWKVTFGGVTESLTTKVLADYLTWSNVANGTYTYSVTPNPGWHQSTLPYSGSVVVKGASVVVSVLLYWLVTYSVTLSESGLPSGLLWTVAVNSVIGHLTTNGGTDSLTWTGLPNGTYAYSITGNAGWHQTTLPYKGSLTVNGGSNSISGSGNGYSITLVYSKVTYSVSFSESGLPSGLTWTVTVNGVAEHLTTNGGTDTLTWTGLPNGTYAYAITAISGEHQSTLPSSGSVVVNGAAVVEPTLRYT